MTETTVSAEKVCPKCGKHNSIDQQFCGGCGYNFSKPSKKISFKLLIAIIAGAVCIIVASIVLIIYNSPSNTFARKLGNDDLISAVELFKGNTSSKFKAVARSQVTEYVNQLPERFGSGELAEDDVREYMSVIKEIYDLSKILPDIDEIAESKKNFSGAEDAKNSTDYTNAIELYGKVSAKDTENYENSQIFASECVELYSSSLISDAENEIAKDSTEKGYSSAIKMLTNAKSSHSDCINESVTQKIDELTLAKKDIVCKNAIKNADEKSTAIEAYECLLKVSKDDYSDTFEKTLTEYQSKASDYVLNYVKDCIDKKDYDGAFKCLNSVPSELSKVSTVKELKKNTTDEFVTAKLGEADKKASAGQYQQAITILDTASKTVSDTRFSSKSKEYQKEADIVYIKSAKNYFVLKRYDEFNHYTRVLPYATTYYSDYSSLYNVRPQIVIYDEGDVVYGLSFGFSKYDWVFMNKITVDCDGKQFSYSVESWDRDTDVYGGGKITEVWNLIHSSTVSSDDQIKDVSSMIEEMEKSKTVKVRFSGSGGKCDVTLPQAEINKIVVLWKIYNILERNPDLKSYVI